MTDYDVVIVGGGPAGLSAGLNLVRMRRRVLILDSNRPRHSATLISHGFLTRDGIPPVELRKLGREEFETYENAAFHQGVVTAIRAIEPSGAHPVEFQVIASGIRGSADRDVTASTVLLAHGLTETLPALPSLRAYYGTSIHSCIECDGFEKADKPLALFGVADDLYERALLLSQLTDDLIVFSDAIDERGESDLLARGVTVERRAIVDLVGERGVMTGVALIDDTVIPRSGGFVRPEWSVPLGFTDELGIGVDRHGLVEIRPDWQTSAIGVFAAGDITPPGPQQLVIAAGSGARAALAINRFLVG